MGIFYIKVNYYIFIVYVLIHHIQFCSVDLYFYLKCLYLLSCSLHDSKYSGACTQQLVSDSVRVRAVDVLKTCDTQNIPMP